MKRILFLILVIGIIGCETILETQIDVIYTEEMPEEIAQNGGIFNR